MSTSSKRVPHVHAELIRAWADGAVIQFRKPDETWGDIRNNEPLWEKHAEYRIKPETIRYRVALFNGINTKYVGLSYPNDYVGNESDKDFIRWLGDEQEVEV